ncbi:cytochrome P450 [Sphingomonas crocodyli]|uniref:Cytochrome P450 n=1 Tax=Sphingomonas crocodyli TaxID=1979270 RepID=A0A437M000_9SPHN|nr:cytochrome P450 [Sphingomonas crocodyli]RVT90824.1 cytochrome P450 [Sphingomonas crocodyli]
MSVATTPETACPVHGGPDQRKSARLAAGGGTIAPDISTATFDQARAVLRSGHTSQAGFLAEQVGRISKPMRQPILYLEGEAHRVQRSATARFFTPRVVTTRYRDLMVRLSDDLVGGFRKKKRARLDDLSLELAVAVAGDIVGLNTNDIRGLSKRLDAFFTGGFEKTSGKWAAIKRIVHSQVRVFAFYYRDVVPAIRARKKARQDDVISHLIDEGYTGREILTECLVYGAAGMATTREFIVMAAWHMLEREELRTAFLAADESGKIALLEELLRLEPVVGFLFRRMKADLPGDDASIKAGEAVAIDVRAANTDEAAFGACPHAVEPGRKVSAKYGNAGLSFGDGEHRCPGAQVALYETCLFLERLLATPGLKLERAPDIKWNRLVTGYELRNAVITCD